MPNGTVKFFNAAKGFGFITPDQGGKDVFVPGASVVSAGILTLKPGQRIAFEAMPEDKGPKAVNLMMLAGLPLEKVIQERRAPVSNDEEREKFTIYYNPTCDTYEIALAELRAVGCEPHMVDYIANPPNKDELKALSMLLRVNDQSLVRKFDAFFHELHLDDRFISDDDFWGAIVENPVLLDGPVLATPTKAFLCRSANTVRKFLGNALPA
jgi:arsenate reductase (glutaredoxin)